MGNYTWGINYMFKIKIFDKRYKIKLYKIYSKNIRVYKENDTSKTM